MKRQVTTARWMTIVMVSLLAVPIVAGCSSPDACACPICSYLDASDWPSETLADGTIVRRVPEAELPTLQALMNIVGASIGPGAPLPPEGVELLVDLRP